MAQYIKHCWKDMSGEWIPINKDKLERRYPEAEYPGLDVEIWMTEETLINGKYFGVDVCLSIVPDSTPVADITETFYINGVNVQRKVVQVITESGFNAVKTPYDQIAPLNIEADRLYIDSQRFSGDEKIQQQVDSYNKRTEADGKLNEAQEALAAL